MSVTNPPPIRVPQEFTANRNTFAYFNELHTFLRLLWERTGGGTDLIEGAGDAGDSLVSTYSHAARIAALGLDVDSVERTAFLGLSTPDKAQIEAVRAEIGRPDVFSFTPDNARYGSVTVELAELGTTAGMGLSTLPLLAKVGGIDSRLTEAEADIAAIVVATADDPLLEYSALPDKARIEALKDEIGKPTLFDLTPDAARYGSVTVQIATLEEGLADAVADIAAIAAGDPLLAYSALPDNARIAALAEKVERDGWQHFTPEAARYGELSVRVGGVEADVIDLAADVAAITAGDPILAYSTLPLLARVGLFDDRLTTAESDIADLESDVAAITAGDPLLAYSSLPDKAAISALRDDVTAVDRAMVALQPLHAKLAADSTRLDAHEALNEAYFAYFEILLTAISDTANTQFMLAGPPLAGRVAALSEQADATNILAFPGPGAARYAALVEQLKDEVQNLRIEIAALYSDRAKLAHLDNRLADVELVSWL